MRALRLSSQVFSTELRLRLLYKVHVRRPPRLAVQDQQGPGQELQGERGQQEVAQSIEEALKKTEDLNRDAEHDQ